MAQTTMATGDSLKKQLYEEKLFRDVVKESYFLNKYTGKQGDETAIVNINTKLEAGKGDNVRFGIFPRFTGNFIVDGPAEGHEQAATWFNDSVTIHKYRVAVADDGEMTRQRPMFDLYDQMKGRLKDQMTENIDELCFTAIQASPTLVYSPLATATKYTAYATAKTALTSASLPTPNFLSWIKTVAETGLNRTITPLRKVKINNKSYFVYLTHNDALMSLEVNDDIMQARREAEVRGKDNPLFYDSFMVWNNVIVHSHENMTIGTNAGAGSDIAFANGVLMGAQSLLWAWARRPRLVEETFDYEDRKGVDFSFLAGTKKPVFNSQDYGSIGCITARSRVSDPA